MGFVSGLLRNCRRGSRRLIKQDQVSRVSTSRCRSVEFTNICASARAVQIIGFDVNHMGRVFQSRLKGVAYRLRRIAAKWRFLEWNCLRIWCGAFRSLIGHIESQSARVPFSVDFGPALQVGANGQYQPNERTLARALCTEKLRAIYPWVDTVDLRVFLMGFDEGERCARDQSSPAPRIRN